MKLRSANHQLHLVRLYLAIIFLQLLYMKTGWSTIAVLECWAVIAALAEFIIVDIWKRWNGEEY